MIKWTYYLSNPSIVGLINPKLPEPRHRMYGILGVIISPLRGCRGIGEVISLTENVFPQIGQNTSILIWPSSTS
jgi:hypothetical protein